MTAPEVCNWKQTDWEYDSWETDCENAFVIIEGTPSENGMKFCCYCGKPLAEHPYKWPDLEVEE